MALRHCKWYVWFGCWVVGWSAVAVPDGLRPVVASFAIAERTDGMLNNQVRALPFVRTVDGASCTVTFTRNAPGWTAARVTAYLAEFELRQGAGYRLAFGRTSVHRIIFTARSREVELIFSNRASAPGERLFLNFVQGKPYFTWAMLDTLP